MLNDDIAKFFPHTNAASRQQLVATKTGPTWVRGSGVGEDPRMVTIEQHQGSRPRSQFRTPLPNLVTDLAQHAWFMTRGSAGGRQGAGGRAKGCSLSLVVGTQ